MSLPRLSIAALGGTVSMQATTADSGVVPHLSGQALLSQVPQLSARASVSVETLCLQASASLDFNLLLDVLDWARQQVHQGASGVLITQGTDTLEETAFFFDLLWPFDTPLVLTGAMRPASQLGADGPANLLQGGLVALSAESRQRGVLVVLNDQVHAAARVRKHDALAMEAFSSPLFGPVGLIVEGNVRYLHPAAARKTLPLPVRRDQRIALLEATLSADTLLLEQLQGLGYQGLVIAGFGAGHVSESWARIAGCLALHIPVVVATRTGTGPTTTASYGFIGGELDLLKRGVRMAGALCPRKVRILLWVLTGCQRIEELPGWLEYFDL